MDKVYFSDKDLRTAFKYANAWLSTIDQDYIDSVRVDHDVDFGIWQVTIYYHKH